ncbi:uncharacterized protein [Oscarella lobularis]|uniref:uncharacterized protein n=1 Tax=Oscarella lobularis TaxID=121494 RepID=UPI0033133F0D
MKTAATIVWFQVPLLFALPISGDRNEEYFERQLAKFDPLVCTLKEEAINNWCNLRSEAAWRSNVPSYRRDQAMVFYSRNESKIGSPKRLLLFGGSLISGIFHSQTDESSLGDTWIYSPRTHSWTQLDLKSEPHARQGHTMATLCGSRVFLTGGIYCTDNVCWGTLSEVTPNDTWIFDGQTETWIEVQTTITNGSKSTLFSRNFEFHSFAVLGQNSSNCSCKESLFVVLFNPIGLTELWLLNCVNDSGFDRGISPEYRWEHIETKPDEVVMSIAPYVDYHMNVYFFGLLWPDIENLSFRLLRFNVSTREWEKGERIHHNFNQFGSSVHGYYTTLKTLVVSNGLDAVTMNLDGAASTFHSADSNYKARLQSIAFASAAVNKNELFVYGGHPTDSNMWRLQGNEEKTGVSLEWVRDNTPILSPNLLSTFAAYTTINDHLLYFTGHYENLDVQVSVEGQDIWTYFIHIWHMTVPEMWTLDLKTFRWWRYDLDEFPDVIPFTASVVSYHNYLLLGFGLRKYFVHDDAKVSAVNELWLYLDHLRTWVQLGNVSSPSPRAFASLVSLQNSSFLLFGGVAPQGDSNNVSLFNDLWILTVIQGRREKEFDFEWREVRVSDNALRPSGRFGHSAYYSHTLNSMYVFSGQLKIAGRCFQNYTWQFNLMSASWSRHKILNVGTSPSQNFVCQYKGVMLGKRIIVADDALDSARCIRLRQALIEKQSPGDIKRKYCPQSRGLYTLDFNEKKWIRLSQYQSPGNDRQVLFARKDEIFSINMRQSDTYGETASIWSFKPGCFAGYNSTDFTSIPCRICPKGTFSNAGAKTCTMCPTGMTTELEGSIGFDNCTCIRDYCHHGKCVPVRGKDTVFCKCDAGYTGLTCQTPTYYLIGSGALIVAIVVGLFSGCLGVSWRYRKKQKIALETAEGTLEKTRQQLNDEEQAWAIDAKKLTIKDVIATGGFGVVYRGEYCGDEVAVKKLKPEIVDIMKDDNAKELNMMKRVRHKNIVLFIGAVWLPKDVAPAFVVEFMEMGSLRGILDDAKVELDYERKLRCALDAAKGMQYLHSLDPPRLHRDLKCANLLVDTRWCVKVADFGCALLLRGSDESAVDDTPPSGVDSGFSDFSEDVPLISLRGKDRDRLKYSSYSFGTSLWKAPEAVLKKGYGTSADVYSFGIVLWEIITRKLPYQDIQSEYKYMCDLMDSIISGLRPTLSPSVLSQSCPNDYVELMTACWDEEPNERPPFKVTQSRLKEMLAATA